MTTMKKALKQADKLLKVLYDMRDEKKYAKLETLISQAETLTDAIADRKKYDDKGLRGWDVLEN